MSTPLTPEAATEIAIQHLVLCDGKAGGSPLIDGAGAEYFPLVDSFDTRELAIQVGDKLVIFRAAEVKG